MQTKFVRGGFIEREVLNLGRGKLLAESVAQFSGKNRLVVIVYDADMKAFGLMAFQIPCARWCHKYLRGLFKYNAAWLDERKKKRQMRRKIRKSEVAYA